MFESMTVAALKSAMLAEIAAADNPPSTREGSFAEGVVAGAAGELFKAYQSLNATVSIAFVDEGSGAYIDAEAEKFGLTRKAGTRATVVLHLTGPPGGEIPAGTAFVSEMGLAFFTDEAVTLDGAGLGTVAATAAEPGAAYNVEAGALTRMFVNLAQLRAWQSDAATGGTDEERDAALLARVEARRQNPGTSGNVAHYEQWALEVEGVGGVKVLPLENGPGTVTVLVVDSNLQPAAQSILDAVAVHVEDERPIGASVTVRAPDELDIAVAATVTLDSTTTLDAVREAFTAGLRAYVGSLVFKAETLLYNRVLFLLLTIPGVTDGSVTVNGAAVNISIPSGSIPVLEAVSVT